MSKPADHVPADVLAYIAAGEALLVAHPELVGVNVCAFTSEKPQARVHFRVPLGHCGAPIEEANGTTRIAEWPAERITIYGADQSC